MIIAISGLSGCGNTSVSSLLSKQLNLKFINYTFRNMAQDKGIEFSEFLKLVKDNNNYDYDIELDKKLVYLASEGDCVVGSRLAIWLLKDLANLKVYLDVSFQERIARISKRENKPFEIVEKETLRRDQNDTKRYIKLYNIDNRKKEIADLIIKSDDKSAEEISGIIMNECKQRSLI